jgi:hypothetical protein
MLIKKAADIRSTEITPRSLYLRRREFIQEAAGIGAVAALAGVLGGAEPAPARRAHLSDALRRGVVDGHPLGGLSLG